MGSGQSQRDGEYNQVRHHYLSSWITMKLNVQLLNGVKKSQSTAFIHTAKIQKTYCVIIHFISYVRIIEYKKIYIDLL